MTELSHLSRRELCDLEINRNIIQSINRFTRSITEHNFWTVPNLSPDQVVEFMRSLEELLNVVSKILNDALNNKVIGLGKAKRVIVVPSNNDTPVLMEDINSSTAHNSSI